ncbi:hypothetical protein [Mesorhizobium sp. M0088]|uniref:hypothetical protein n=1 Tax=Mesorhizobium sp. M0088 TaxID=2956873 RepID=UPI003338AEB5
MASETRRRFGSVKARARAFPVRKLPSKRSGEPTAHGNIVRAISANPETVGTMIRPTALLQALAEESMFTDDVAVRRLKILVQQYVETRKKRHDVISTAKAGTAIREVMPSCPLSGKAFDDLIAACAIEHGLAVLFDNPGTSGIEI